MNSLRLPAGDDAFCNGDGLGHHGINRRTFFKVTALAGGGFLLGYALPGRSAMMSGPATVEAPAGEIAITPWVRITPDNRITIIVSQAEIGQGISTTLPAILADELGADWSTTNLETAPFAADATAYRNPARKWMFTGNSESIEAFYDLMRNTGAAAREMLTMVAAMRWGVDADTCYCERSKVLHRGSSREFTFGEISIDAAKISPPARPRLRGKTELKLIGRAIAKVDIPSKVDGSAVYGIDFTVPDMLLAAVRTAPTIGGSLQSFDEALMRSKPGVRAVVRIPNGIAVVANTYWQAQTALLEGKLAFELGPNATLNSTDLMSQYRRILDDGPWVTAVKEGDTDATLKSASKQLTFDYENPFAAHATMEPMNCTAWVTADKCEIWAPTQGQELAFYALKGVLGMRDEQITVNRTPYAGGGFGRRLVPDFVIQAALISKAVGKPVKLIWDREEDIRRDLYRPASMVRLTAGFDARGMPAAIWGRVVSPTILLPVFPTIAPMLKEQRVDPSALEGMMETYYDLPNRRVDFHLFETVVPTSVMRTTGYGPNMFAFESFIDEMAHATQIDPYLFRRRLLAKNERALAVLDHAAKLGHWDKPLPKGRGRGIAYTYAFETFLAQVIEVEVRGKDVRVTRVASAVDCGRTLDPGIAANNIEGGVIFGLAYCKAEITFKVGRVEQENLNTYELPYLAEAPQMVTEFIDSGAKLGGVGEVSPVTVPPALANAIFAATGRRLRSMPIARHGLRFA